MAQRPPPPAAAPPRPEREREVWLACAGPYARLPDTGSRVYYFPRGHADQCRGARLPVQPVDEAMPCIVSAVELLYRAPTDDPYAIIILLPDQGQAQAQGQPSSDHQHQANPTGSRSAYFVKEISSVNDKEAFIVPKACAESLFPSLNHNNEKQTLHLLDVQRKELEFGHIGDDCLTTGWGQYFRDKQLKHMDAVVFIRSANDQLLIGSRRGITCHHRAREQVQDVVKAAEASVAGGGPFTVTYYPRQSWPFVVPREEVDAANARNINWKPGLKVRIACPVGYHELESSRLLAKRRDFYDGKVEAVNNTTWGKLEVSWRRSWSQNAPTINDLPRRQVNVWQVQFQGEPQPSSMKKRKMSHRHKFAAGHPSSKSKVPCLMPGAKTAQYMVGSPMAAAGVQGGRQGSLTDVPSLSSTQESETPFGAEMAPAPAPGVPTQNIASSSTARSIKLFSVKMAPGVAPVDTTPKDDNPAKNPPAKDDDQNPDESA